MEMPSDKPYSSFCLSPLIMIHLFLLCVLPKSLGGVINRFISESNSFFKFLIPQSYTCRCSIINHPTVLDDADVEGYVPGHHVAMLMEKMGLQFDPDGQECMIEKIIDLGDVCRIFEEKEPSIQELKAAFDVFDCNGDGFIDAFELQRVISVLGLGKGCDLEACQRMIRTFDLNGDDKIGADEFFRFMKNILC